MIALTPREAELARRINEVIGGHNLNEVFTAMLSIVAVNLTMVGGTDPHKAVACAQRFGDLLLSDVERSLPGGHAALMSGGRLQ